MFSKFWNWYRENYTLNLSIAAGLFSLQILHLFWLLLHVILPKLGFQDLFVHFTFLNYLLILVDYTEIPAIISTSLLYISEIRVKANIKSTLFLIFLNIQWLHMFWITDEFIVDTFEFSGLLWWTAIAIDYLEVPVIFDTVKKLISHIRKGETRLAFDVVRNK